MSEEKTQGVLLQTIPYLGRQRILKVFAPEAGLLTLMAKSAKPSWTAISTPFCIAEWVYRKGQKEIHTLQDGSLLDGLMELKQDYAVLNAAGRMAQDLLSSQLPAKSAGDLYLLFCAYLKKLPQFGKPEILAASFRLKLLLHEGLLSLQKECSVCASPASHIAQGESFCFSHATFPTIAFTSEEWEQLHLLAYARQFSLLQEMNKAPFEKIDLLFKERIQ